MKPSIRAAANGHLVLEFGSYDSPLAVAVSLYLTADAGFTRIGDRVAGFDEGIMPGFSRGDLVIEAGWDNWSGEYLLATCDAGDALIRALFGAFGSNQVFNPDALPRVG